MGTIVTKIFIYAPETALFFFTVVAVVSLSSVLGEKLRFVERQNPYPYKLARYVESGQYIVFYIYDIATEQLVRKRDYEPMQYPNARDRAKVVKRIIEEINRDLLNGAYMDSSLEAKPAPVPKPQSNQLFYAEMPLKDALERFKDLKEKTSRIRTRQAYATFITRMNEYVDHIDQQKLRLVDLDRNFVQGFMDYLLITKGVGEKTFNNYLINIKHFFNMLVEREVLLKSPVKGFTKLRTDIGRNTAFSATQKEHLLKVLPLHPELWLFVQFMYYCLIRPNELRQLQIRNLDLKKQTIVVPSDVSKSRKQDSVVIPDAFMPVLLAQNFSQYPEHYYIFSEADGPGETPRGRNTFSRWHREVLARKAELFSKDHTLYSWKHTGAIALYYAVSGDIKALQVHLRHSSLEITDNYLKSLGVVVNYRLRTEYPPLEIKAPDSTKEAS